MERNDSYPDDLTSPGSTSDDASFLALFIPFSCLESSFWFTWFTWLPTESMVPYTSSYFLGYTVSIFFSTQYSLHLLIYIINQAYLIDNDSSLCHAIFFAPLSTHINIEPLFPINKESPQYSLSLSVIYVNIKQYSLFFEPLEHSLFMIIGVASLLFFFL